MLVAPQLHMDVESGRWRPLSPVTLAEAPELPAVFEIGNLVRTVLCIDRAHGNLRARLTALLEAGQLATTPGGYYVRWELTEAEAEALAARLDAYATAREGRAPGSAGEPPRPVKLAKRRAA